MKRNFYCYALIYLLISVWGTSAWAQEDGSPAFEHAARSAQQKLEASLQELNQLREQIANETIPLSRELNALEAQLADVRSEFQQTSRLLDSRTLDVNNLRNEIESRKDEATYLSNLLSEYIRNFETRLHIAELQRYQNAIEEAKLASENDSLSQQEIYTRQARLIDLSLSRIEELIGGTRFLGRAVNKSGEVKSGTFVLIGPAAIFSAHDGSIVGTVEQRLGSKQPAVAPFNQTRSASAAIQLAAGQGFEFPLDPTLGNALKIAQTDETLMEHIQKGGPVMVPIFALAGVALLIALYKWMHLSFVGVPSQRRIDELLDAVKQKNIPLAQQKAKSMRGPAGQMLSVGIDHIREPRDLIEEVMYEKILAARLRLERLLPFISITAASAPLLGLLGTVTGIINTFKLITIFGSGDVQTLSSGISEALVTTEFGLIVAIPALMIHAFLARKARGIVNRMEKAAVAFVNQVSKTNVNQRPADQPSLANDIPPQGTPAPSQAT